MQLKVLDASRLKVSWTPPDGASSSTVWVRQKGQVSFQVFDAASGKLVDSGGKAVKGTECILTELNLAEHRYEVKISFETAYGWSKQNSIAESPDVKPKPPSDLQLQVLDAEAQTSERSSAAGS
eukprot:TRINITY_DN7488_c0_g1_i4.p1 TRINITY_DN7488_c0_g1~~TRINITY_DN7488_c0_g1_i4.p1  ORF type:complete len:124 (-),score=28.09 TRINITY_DN7488_c0_g1_i4:143-514(-)